MPRQNLAQADGLLIDRIERDAARRGPLALKHAAGSDAERLRLPSTSALWKTCGALAYSQPWRAGKAVFRCDRPPVDNEGLLRHHATVKPERPSGDAIPMRAAAIYARRPGSFLLGQPQGQLAVTTNVAVHEALRSKCIGDVPTWRKFQCALWL